MSYQRGEVQSKLGQRQSEEAVELATRGCWEEAVVVNQGIIEGTPGDVCAYNRLGKALFELGDLNGAVEAYSNSLKLEPTNTIAMKNLARLRERLGLTEESSSVITGQVLQPGSKSKTKQRIVPGEIVEKLSNEEDEEEDSSEEGNETTPEGFSSLD